MEELSKIAFFGDWTWVYASNMVVTELVACTSSFVVKPPASKNPAICRIVGFVIHDVGACTSRTSHCPT